MKKRFDLVIKVAGVVVPYRLKLFCTLTQAKQAFWALSMCSLRSNIERVDLCFIRNDGLNGGFDVLDYFCRSGVLDVPAPKA